MILVLGHRGNMGRRYSHILDYLKVEWKGLDISNGPLDNQTIYETADGCDGVIIATPTKYHLAHLNLLADLQVPILCEKPFSYELEDLKKTLLLYQENYTPLSMVLQYKELLNDVAVGDSHYNYFKTGKDGLEFDCIQIIGLAKGKVEIRNDSPVWDCVINGQRLHLSDMDQAYVWAVQRFLSRKYQNLKDIYEIHQRVHDYKTNQSSNRNPGQEHI